MKKNYHSGRSFDNNVYSHEHVLNKHMINIIKFSIIEFNIEYDIEYDMCNKPHQIYNAKYSW